VSSSSSAVPIPVQLAQAEAAGEIVRRRPGRPLKIRAAVTLDQVQLAKAESVACEEFVCNDPLVRSLEAKASSTALLRRLVLDLATEAAAIRFEVASAQALAKSDGIPQSRSRVLDAYAKIGAIVLQSQKLGLVEIDLRSEPVQRVFGLFLSTLEEVARETLTDYDSFMTECRHALDGWETRV